MPADVASSVGGKVFTFGSYRLGVEDFFQCAELPGWRVVGHVGRSYMSVVPQRTACDLSEQVLLNLLPVEVATTSSAKASRSRQTWFPRLGSSSELSGSVPLDARNHSCLPTAELHVQRERFHQVRHGLATTEEIMKGNCGWECLFDTPNFFPKYKYFIVLLASSSSPNDQLQWSGLVESKIRHLIGQ
ncbi:hypothetical protein HF086_004340 [Spodoptera exigua]|uniref:Poly(A) polymerase RNA-binding domain-containing protein n=1 Tax=Spodoptera exigua TaxID=7107 RepID=A0A922SET0_SPOEX|nr:hypothetical protein HF086_004340 [Spodoptera exigua]